MVVPGRRVGDDRMPAGFHLQQQASLHAALEALLTHCCCPQGHPLQEVLPEAGARRRSGVAYPVGGGGTTDEMSRRVCAAAAASATSASATTAMLCGAAAWRGQTKGGWKRWGMEYEELRIFGSVQLIDALRSTVPSPK